MSRKPTSVSPNNPCPFLRALVAQGMVADDVEPIGKVVGTVVNVARAGEGEPNLPKAAIYAIAAIANGIGPLSVAGNALTGLHLNTLRGGPLDKKGVGSGILDAQARVDEEQLVRLEEFASAKTDAAGQGEAGLNLAELTRMMDANFARAKDRRRAIDRKLMDGEWPVLLKVMGKESQSGRYLSVAELRDLFIEKKLPQRMMQRLGGA
jgi:hypothetical protein